MYITTEQRDAVLREAATWINTPWHHLGRIKGAGVDCGQLLIEVYLRAGIVEDFDTGEYAQAWAMHRHEEHLLPFVERFADPVDVPSPADIVVYKFGRTFSHAGIVIAWPLIVHANRVQGVVAYDDGEQGILNDRKRVYYGVRA